MICPNFNDENVKKAFDELKDAVGEIAAYDIWNQNGGNGIDMAPNGEPSKLFTDLLSHYKGNRQNAVVAKAKLYGKGFKEWFGDWTNSEATDVSKIVDQNGEPLINGYNNVGVFVSAFQLEADGSPVITSNSQYKAIDNKGTFDINTEDMFDVDITKPFAFDKLYYNQEAYYQYQLQQDAITLEDYLSIFETHNFDNAQELQTRLQNIRKRLTANLESRLKSIDIKDATEASKLKAAIKYQLNNLANNQIDTITNILSILQDLKSELQPVAHKVIDAYQGKSHRLSNADLISLDRNFFGFYNSLAEEVRKELNGLDSYRLIIGKDNYDKIFADLNNCSLLLNECSNFVKKMLVDNAVNLMHAKGIQAKSPTIYNYIQSIKSNRDETETEISTLTRWLGAGDKINDEAVKAVYSIVQEAEDKTLHAVFNKTKDLMQLLKNAGNKQKMLFETDDNGKPTGYIVRAVKYGQFKREYKLALKQIRMDLGIDPNETMLPENKDLRVEYNKRKNKWLSEHAERKYTDEYYNLFNELSQEASDAREMVQAKIRNITDKVKDSSGFIEYERLTDEEWDALNAYYIEKRQLSSIYDVYGNLKQGTEYDIARDLTDLNKKLAEGLKMDVNQSEFDRVSAEKKATLSSKEYQKWLQRNTRQQFSEEFYDLLKQVDRAQYGTEYSEKNQIKRDIMNMFRDTKTGEVNVKLIPPAAINTINKIDRELRAIRKRRKTAPREGAIAFEDIAKIVPTEQFKADERAVLANMEDNPGLVEAFYQKHTNVGPDGRRYPKSYYQKVVPKDIKYVQTVPSMNFTELSEDSPFFNRKFSPRNRALHQVLKDINPKYSDSKIDGMISTNDKQDAVYASLNDRYKRIVDMITQDSKDEYYQPKVEQYGSFKNFSDIVDDPNLFALREGILNTMDESNKKLKNRTDMNKYKMPQISGSMYRFMASNHGILGGFAKYMVDSVSTKNDDVGIQRSTKYAPDGSSLNFIPQYFVEDLEEASTINADLVGGTLRYFQMAENYQNKGAIREKVESIKAFIASRRYVGSQKGQVGKAFDWLRQKKGAKEGRDTNIYKFVEKFIDMNIYDVKTNAMTFTVKGREVNLTKALTKFKALGTLRNLAWSLWISGTGLFTAMHNMLVQSIVGRYYDFDDSVNATKEMALHLLYHSWRTVGNKNYKSKQMALMDYFEIGSTVDSMFKNSNNPALLRIFDGHWAFGFYSMVDFFVKGSIMNAVMFNYKNVKGEFLNKEDYFNKYGKTEETKSNWGKYKSAYSSVDYVNGRIVIKDPKDQKAWDTVKDVIGRSAQNLGASADGTLTTLQKAQFSANVFGSMAMMHRQYIPLAIQEKWTMERQWDYTSQRYKEGILRTPLRVLSEVYRDNNNLNQIQKALKTIQILSGIKSGITDTQTLSNMKQLRTEMILIWGLYPILSSMLNEAADDDKKNKLINTLAYIMMRTEFEAYSPYNLIDIAATIKNPTPLFSILDNFGNVISYPKDVAYSLVNDGVELNKKITRGAYKGMTVLEKNLIQLTPYKNVIELNDIPSKRNYYKKQILKE